MTPITPVLDPTFITVPLAHRALHDVTDGRPENSRAAIVAAINAGYGIEIDLQFSTDGRAMVFHDYHLSRLTDANGPIAMQTAGDLAKIPLAGGDGETIPELDEILALVGGRVPLLVEFKDQDGAMGTNIGPLETVAAAALAQYRGPLAVMSFNPNSVVELARLLPNTPRGLITCAFTADDWPLINAATREHLATIPDYARSRASFISHQITDLKNPRIAALKSAGADVLCWTVKSHSDEIAARKIAQNITFEGYRTKVPA